MNFEWVLLLRPPYSLNFEPADLDCSPGSHLIGLALNTDQDLKTRLENFFEKKPAMFWRERMHTYIIWERGRIKS